MEGTLMWRWMWTEAMNTGENVVVEEEGGGEEAVEVEGKEGT
jgi:hypothetical protein